MGAGAVMVSRLSVVEVASAIHRRTRGGLLPLRARDAALGALLGDAETWNFIELTDRVADRAVLLMGRHGITSGDAIQLASALAARDDVGGEFGRFVAYDARLLAAARTEGLSTEEY
jgi:predicted nucleic acid-binding protein